MKRDAIRLITAGLFYAPLCLTAASGAELDVDWRMNRIAVAGDNLWLAADKGVVRYDKTTGIGEVFPLEGYEAASRRRVMDVAIAGDGTVWAACGSAGVARYDGSAMTFSNEMNARSDRPCDIITAGPGGTIWAALGYGGLWSCADGSWTQQYQYAGSDTYSAYHNSGLAFDALGTPWWTANAANDGFGYCDAEAGWVCLSRDNPDLNENTPQSLAIDGRGDKWIGCRWPRIIRYSATGDVEVIPLATIDGNDSYAVPVYDVQTGPDGRVWGAYKRSLYSVGGVDDVERIDIPIPADDMISSFKHDGDVIWIGTINNGLYRWAAGSLSHLDINAGIERVAADETARESDAVYDLTGRRVTLPAPAAVYIRGGKKFYGAIAE